MYEKQKIRSNVVLLIALLLLITNTPISTSARTVTSEAARGTPDHDLLKEAVEFPPDSV